MKTNIAALFESWWRCSYCYCAIIALIVCVILILSHSVHPSIEAYTHNHQSVLMRKMQNFPGAFTDILLPYFLSLSSSSILSGSPQPTLYLAKRGKFDFAICTKFYRKPIYPNKQSSHCHLIYCFLSHKRP